MNRNDKSIRLWDVEQKKLIKTFKGPSRIVRRVAFHPSGKWLAAGSLDNSVYLWHMNKQDAMHTFDWQEEKIHNMLSHPQKGYLMAVGEKNTVRCWQFDQALEVTQELSTNVLTLTSENEGKFSQEGGIKDNSKEENLRMFLQMLQALSGAQRSPMQPVKQEEIPIMVAAKRGKRK